MKKVIERANILIEALPYIRKFRGNTFVVKYGGAAMDKSDLAEKVAQDVILMKYVGINPVLVHGGGPEITRVLKKQNLGTNFIHGLRVTDRRTMEVVERVLVKKINRNIVDYINKHSGKAMGLNGRDAGFLLVKKYMPGGLDIGFVGEVVKVNSRFLSALAKDFIPVIAPVGVDGKGQVYNVNADEAASKIAVALKADKLIMLTDVRGVLDKKGKLMSSISKKNAKKAMSAAGKGMIPKLKGCFEAVSRGVKKVHIIDGRIPHALLLEIFTDEGIGTQIT
ncbi:acetylglutamate kinase [Candidatus Desantisbacteria bacterium CG_4_10_14_0_8_um_filter_48_22]|uniref:Acetylglutamate kinase n=1 Tax=Candidatus Desantisbacteria bacterium CG_4_10_14_0_8_um_filter_48_22 TaxID=1974543 RepID=A0A2M7S9W1_9BACT|nr:MAG: acetylglutamate kinase [Candidatus Desantisbacteria bacterium CG1_02_49_89]PIV57493.1 MAG: acetylglutamate kinase [Candidatus Desantisbacteria bacterium CG02_land_8_20_14_3_00_49_13]PIZ16083.1 MAG: acetylglutamate kinase [Candidatus Desantisbacteria bacterium CG_4_10_14_0_8_um_filter_48_22]